MTINFINELKNRIRRIDKKGIKHTPITSVESHACLYRLVSVYKGIKKTVAWGLTKDEITPLTHCVTKKLSRLNEYDSSGNALFEITGISIEKDI